MVSESGVAYGWNTITLPSGGLTKLSDATTYLVIAFRPFLAKPRQNLHSPPQRCYPKHSTQQTEVHRVTLNTRILI